jgi:hypothetical protein
MKRFSALLLILGLSASVLAGCATIGRDFPDDFALKINLNQTTRADIEKTLGAPFRTGLDSGNPTSTYLYYRLGLFSQPVTKDLTITYTAQNTVKAYTFNANDQGAPEDPNSQKDYNKR